MGTNISKISINYNDIKWIFKRKYFYKNSAFEIYTTTNKTYYFWFDRTKYNLTLTNNT